jgi:hypothetical protein
VIFVIGEIFICMRTIYIYSLKDPETNEIRYVGKTTNINTRLKAHITRSRHNKYHSARWVQSVIKRGLRPIIELVEECTEENWVEREKYWIGYYRERFDLTNILEGGEGGSTFGRLGKPWSDEQRKNNAIARTGLSVSRTKEGNANRKKGVRGYYDKNKKPVLQYDLEGKFIREWESAVDAGKDLKISYSDINRSCKKEGYTSAGFQWRYKVGEVKNEINKYVKPENGSNVEVIQMTKEGERIKEFKSIMDASRQTAILNSSINNCLSGRSQSAGGYKWKYKQ